MATPTPTPTSGKENAAKRSCTSKPFGKITVHNVLSESGANSLQQHIANQNTIIRKIKDFGMLGTVNNAAATTTNTPVANRKRPLGESQKLNTATTSTSTVKRTKLTKKTEKPSKALECPKPAGTPGRKGLPLPQAVARRNARERNRVKQVNNGFAALRERIPEEVSEAFEAQGAGRGASKKLSKVETLRMAVEYIRSLERLLGFDFPPLGCHSNSSSSGEDSFMFIKDEFEGLDEQFDDSLSNYEVEETSTANTTAEDLMLPSVTTLNGLQYVRIPGTNTYQLLSTTDEEHFNALIDTNCLNLSQDQVRQAAAAAAAAAAALENGECVKFTSNLSRSPVPTAIKAAVSSSSNNTSNTSSSSHHSSPCTSPNTSAVNAVSPVASAAAAAAAAAVANELLLQACAAQQQLIKQEYAQQQQQQQQQQLQQPQPTLSSPPASSSSSSTNFQLCSNLLPAFYDQEPVVSFYDNVEVGLPSFKKEFTDIQAGAGSGGGCLSDESMIDAIDWWEAHTPKSDGGATNESSNAAAVLM